MRSWSLTILLAACTSNAADPSDPSNPSDPSVETVAMTCSTSVASYCAANGCDRTLAEAEKDRALCPASVMTCGAFDVVMTAGIDTMTSFYYKDGELIAIGHAVLPRRHDCLAGPATFSAPLPSTQCATTSRTLPVCGPVPK